MDYYNNVYLNRLNRYGLNYQSRIQSQREQLFETRLMKSVYLISFDYQDEEYTGSFERYKQDETETLHYLLTCTSLNIPNGTILFLPDKDNNLKPWMVYYLEHIVASGYNKYIMLKMTHEITWTARDGSTQTSWAYMYGQEDNMLKDEIRSRSRMDTLYTENLKTSFFVLPTNEKIRKDDYLIIGQGTPLEESYRVTGYDIQSSEGVEYVTVDPTYKRDESATPVPKSGDNPNDYFWLYGEEPVIGG